MAPTAPSPRHRQSSQMRLLRHRNFVLAPSCTELCPTFPGAGPGASSVLRPTPRFDDEVIPVAPSSVRQQMGLTMRRLTNPFVIGQLREELNPQLASNSVTLRRFDFKAKSSTRFTLKLIFTFSSVTEAQQESRMYHAQHSVLQHGRSKPQVADASGWP